MNDIDLEAEARHCLSLAIGMAAEEAKRCVARGVEDPLVPLTDPYWVPIRAKDLIRTRNAELFMRSPVDCWEDIESDLNLAVARLLPEPEPEECRVLCKVCGYDYWGADEDQARSLHNIAEDHACQPAD